MLWCVWPPLTHLKLIKLHTCQGHAWVMFLGWSTQHYFPFKGHLSHHLIYVYVWVQLGIFPISSVMVRDRGAWVYKALADVGCRYADMSWYRLLPPPTSRWLPLPTLLLSPKPGAPPPLISLWETLFSVTDLSKTNFFPLNPIFLLC